MRVQYRGVDLDIEDSESIPITKQVNEVGNLNVFKSDFSRNFRIKRTRKMEDLLDRCGNIQSTSVLPYTSISVRVISDGVDVVPNARLMIINSDSHFYYCSAASEIKDVFKSLAKKNLNALNLHDLNHIMDAEVQRDSVLNDEDYQYLLCDFSDDGNMTRLGSTDRIEAQERMLRPFVKAKRVFAQILEDSNITISSDILERDDFQRMFVPIASILSTAQNTENFLSKGYVNKGGILNLVEVERRLNLKYYTMGLGIQNPKKAEVFDPLNLLERYTYTARITGRHYFHFEWTDLLIFNQFFEGFVGDLTVRVNGSAATFRKEGNTIIQQGIYISVPINYDDEVEFFLSRDLTFELNLSEYYFSVTRIEVAPNARIERGLTVSVPDLLPPVSQLDFIKSFLTYFGYIVEYDSVRNELKTWQLNDVLTNKGRARDWSEYLSVRSDNSLGYRLDYAQTNWLKFKPSDDVGVGNGDGYISVMDMNLPAERDILNIPFSGMDIVEKGGETYGRIGWFVSEDDSNTYKEKNSIEPRLVVSAPNTDRFVRYIDSENALIYFDLTLANSRKAMPLYLSEGIHNHRATQRMLESTKRIEVKMNLPAREVKNLDHAYPVMLRQYGAAFFVERVSDWMEGDECTVTLIRI